MTIMNRAKARAMTARIAALCWNDTASLEIASPRSTFFNQFRSRYRHAIGRKNNHLSHAMGPVRRHRDHRRANSQKLARMLKHACQLSFTRTFVAQNQYERAAFTECYASPEKIIGSMAGER
jgi:hypothetical protein